MQAFDIKNNFPDDFYDALGRLVVAFGRVEYVIKLTVKSLSAEGFTRGMAHAESQRTFRLLCKRAKELGNDRLPSDKAAQFTALIDQAITLAPQRNDNTHSCWTTDNQATPLRLRSFWNTRTDPKQLEWRSRTVMPDELRQIAAAMDALYRALQQERKTWPQFQTE